MSVLLDTHVLLWWQLDSPRLSETARRWIAEADVVYVSAASIYEIDDKRRQIRAKQAQGRTGRQPDQQVVLLAMPDDLLVALPTFGLRILEITAEAAWLAARLPFDHPDPWDRILVAQAKLLACPLITADRRLHDQAKDTPIVW
ncbi:type II toxin-antitoxin system VapC family toxin [Caulobacter mirabilis]|uniref:PIN domain-containing protein n=1 Tax=Caulobacter mirabilis TaxID=69666 RepID=A0A2D2AVZ5_9CAUL|nr:type II toxin-antitoxin system VapC family toxin [Caulobacter mirabilis]ATQ42127.1 hypothetical protein CSW64_06710 [Caulobacter mirabilis]